MQDLAQKQANCPQHTAEHVQNGRTERQKIGRRAKRQRRKIEQPELPAPRIEREGEQRKKKCQRKQNIQHSACAPQQSSHCAQTVVPEPQQCAKSYGKEKLRRLKTDRQLHQPNSRAKKPPAGWASS